VNEPAGGFRHVGDRLVHRGTRWDVVAATFDAPDGSRFEREIVRSLGAVAVVPLLAGADVATVALVSQYRPAHDRQLIEIPAGMRDVAGEPPMETARRELVEEVGLVADELSLLAECRVSAAMTDATTILYLATDCRPTARRPEGPEEDHSEVLHVPLADALEWVRHGRIDDAKSVIGLLLADAAVQQCAPRHQ
jgi:ADP-ribose pyrophosphatase